MKKVILSIDGMSCSACAMGLEKYLKKQEGIKEVSVNLVLAQAFITYTEFLTLDDLNRFVLEAGFKSLGEYKPNREEHITEKKRLLFFTVYIIFFMIFSMLYKKENIILSLFSNYSYYTFFLFFLSLPFLFYGFSIFKKGIVSLLYKMPNMDTLVTIGVFASLGYSIFVIIRIFLGDDPFTYHLYFDSAVMVIYFVKLGRYIDYKSKEKTKDSIKGLVQITPTFALVKTNNKEKEVTIDEVKKGDILIAKPGMKIAVDGKIVTGETHINESFITGESIPLKKGKNDKVVAGSINIDGYIEYKAELIGKNSTISSIVHLVMEATNTKMPIARLVDKISAYFVPFILLFAFITFVSYLLFSFPLEDAVLTFVTILVVACPCALGLATPLAIVISEGICAQNGILVKKSEILELAKDIDTVVFDKTGTLTCGDIRISKIYNYSKYTEEKLMEKIASIESKSTHPIGNAFLFYAKSHSLKLKPVKKMEVFSGVGILGFVHSKKIYIGNEKLFSMLSIENPYQKEEELLRKLGNSIVYVIEDGVILSLIGVKDIVRRNAKKTVMELKCLRKDIIMLTGDHLESAQKIANELGISHVIAGVLPKDKKKTITDLIKNGKKVMMVGDGINDAPSLAHATVGVSMTGATDIAADSADVILLHNKLDKIAMLIKISKETVTNIKRNLFWAFFYNICMLPIAAGILKPFGIFMNPMIASFAMVLSSFTVIMNALRLKKINLDL